MSQSVALPRGYVDAKIAMVTVAILGEVVQGGLFFGWNALAIMIRALGNYSEGCDPTEVLCKRQESKLAVIWTVGIFALNCGPVMMGFVLDYLGPKATSMIGTGLNMLGLILFACGRSDGPRAFIPGGIFLGLGGITFHLAQFHSSALFPRSRGLIAAALVAGFTGSGVVMYLLQLVFKAADSTRAAYLGVLLGYAGLCALWFPVTAWIMPNSPFQVGDVFLFRTRDWRFEVRKRTELESLYRRGTLLRDFLDDPAARGHAEGAGRDGKARGGDGPARGIRASGSRDAPWLSGTRSEQDVAEGARATIGEPSDVDAPPALRGPRGDLELVDSRAGACLASDGALTEGRAGSPTAAPVAGKNSFGPAARPADGAHARDPDGLAEIDLGAGGGPGNRSVLGRRSASPTRLANPHPRVGAATDVMAEATGISPPLLNGGGDDDGDGGDSDDDGRGGAHGPADPARDGARGEGRFDVRGAGETGRPGGFPDGEGENGSPSAAASPPTPLPGVPGAAQLNPSVAWGPLVFEARRFVELRKKSFREQLSSSESFGMGVFYTTNMFMMQFYLGTMRLQLASKAGDSASSSSGSWNSADAYSNFGNVIVAFAFLSMPLIAWLLDAKGYGATLGVINALGVVGLALQALPWLPIQALSIVIWMVSRFFMYASYFAIFGALFGFRNFGRLVAVDNTFNGLVGLLQYPITYLALHQLDNRFWIINIIQAVLLLPLFFFCRSMYVWEREDLVPIRPLEGEELPCDQVGFHTKKDLPDSLANVVNNINSNLQHMHLPDLHLREVTGALHLDKVGNNLRRLVPGASHSSARPSTSLYEHQGRERASTVAARDAGAAAGSPPGQPSGLDAPPSPANRPSSGLRAQPSFGSTDARGSPPPPPPRQGSPR